VGPGLSKAGPRAAAIHLPRGAAAKKTEGRFRPQCPRAGAALSPAPLVSFLLSFRAHDLLMLLGRPFGFDAILQIPLRWGLLR